MISRDKKQGTEDSRQTDLSEQGSLRADEKATTIARQVEGDDLNGEAGRPADEKRGGGDDPENRVWTSLSED